MSDQTSMHLPPNWARTTIGATIEDKVPQTGPNGNDTFTYIDIGGIDNSTKRIVDPKVLSVAEAPSRARQVLAKNDVLVSMTRPNLNAVAKVPAELDGAIGSTGFDVLRTRIVEPSWLYYAVQSNHFIHAMCQVVQGALYPAVRPRDIRSYSLPIPPVNEQRRIVAKIEELFSDLDAAVAALKRVKANLKNYRAAVLKAAVEGKLTAEWRAKNPTEPASKLLERILAERRRKWEADQLAKFAAAGKEPPKDWKAKYAEPTTPDLAGGGEVPEGWVVASVDQLTTTITSGSRDWTRYYGSGTGTFIMAQNVRKGHLDLTFRQSVNPPAENRDRIRSQVAGDDLLVTIVGANTGDVCRVPIAFPEHYVCQSVALMRPVLPAISKFVESYFAADHGGQKHFRRYIYGQGRPHLGFDELRMTPVVLPPLCEQSQIIAEVEERLSSIEAAEKLIEVNLGRVGRLRQAILSRAFEGRLVPQDPGDEPAIVLLDRLKDVGARTDSEKKGEAHKRRPRMKTSPVGNDRHPKRASGQ